MSAGNPLSSATMRPLQGLIVALCVLLFAIDGFDVLSISFAASGIVREWNIERSTLGVVLSMELIGMAGGGFVLGPLADRIGRRPTTLLCLLLISAGMWAAVFATGPISLSIARVVTGLGIGGMLPAITVVAAEFSSLNRRDQSAALVPTGYPLGAVIGGTAAAALLVDHDWRSVFLLGAVLSTCCIPLVWFCLPESIEYLLTRRPKDALSRINQTLAQLGHASLLDLPPAMGSVSRQDNLAFLRPALAGRTLLLSLVYLGHMITAYFILKWGAKIITDFGHPASAAGSVLVWGNLGGLTGCILLTLLAPYISVKHLVWFSLGFSTLAVALFGQGFTGLHELSLIAAGAGFFTQSALVGLYAIIVQSYPTEVRTGAFGFIMGIGRGGAALSPILAGMLFQSGVSLSAVAMTMAAGSILALMALFVQSPPSKST